MTPGRGKHVKFRVYAFAFLGLALALPAVAQEGHPFKGTWRGEIAMPGGPQAIVIIMNYDGDNITGMINPGRRSFNFTSSELDAPNWRLSASATTRDGITVALNGMLHDIGAKNRYIDGDWEQGGASYPFRITRE